MGIVGAAYMFDRVLFSNDLASLDSVCFKRRESTYCRLHSKSVT